MNSYLLAMSRYFDFGGRSRRSEYWLFFLWYTLFALLAMGFDIWCSLKLPEFPSGALVWPVVLFHTIPSISVSVRRLHDIGRSGAWYLLYFVPFGAFILFVWAFYGSEMGSNDYGDDPTDAPPPGRRGPSPGRSGGGHDGPSFGGRTARSGDYAKEVLGRIRAGEDRIRSQFNA